MVGICIVEIGIFCLILLGIGLYFYLDTETCWSNIKSPKDLLDLFILRTKQHFCKHEWKIGKISMYCTKCFHTKSL